MPEKLFRRALVIRGGALGDFLLTLPVLRALREVSQNVEVLAYPQFAALARETNLADNARSIEYGPLAGFFARGALQEPELRAYFASFDFVLSYLFDPDGIFAESLRSAGVKNLVAGPHKPDASQHAIDQLLAPVLALGIGGAERAVLLDMPATASASPLLAIHPGSGSHAKNWAAAQWKDLAYALLAAHPHLNLAVIGGEADRDGLGAFEQLRPDARVAFWENLPLVELSKLLAGAHAYLGHDTGVSHLAAALDVPSLLLFGPTDPAIWAPPHGHVAVLKATEGDLSRLAAPAVLAATEKHLLPRLLASHGAKQQNTP